MSYNLFIDDERNLEDVTWMDWHIQAMYRDESWIIARDIQQVKDLISEKGFPQFISFDHDLGDNQPTGFDITKYLVELDMDKLADMSQHFSFCVHSKNPVGKKNIESYLFNYMKMKGLY